MCRRLIAHLTAWVVIVVKGDIRVDNGVCQEAINYCLGGASECFNLSKQNSNYQLRGGCELILI